MPVAVRVFNILISLFIKYISILGRLYLCNRGPKSAQFFGHTRNNELISCTITKFLKIRMFPHRIHLEGALYITRDTGKKDQEFLANLKCTLKLIKFPNTIKNPNSDKAKNILIVYDRIKKSILSKCSVIKVLDKAIFLFEID
ncbi:hypothetical protein BpHYR1_005065 [Brachionus plicatilis]|uniref:Uncharacterized protein n=1 Tax=Brachionus plicatilis TaxID=10195 RepID=A0A3M7T675_BRAPC|nr:hypothetical protein BpHYR1_005065 [Brachionus plicatilis]